MLRRHGRAASAAGAPLDLAARMLLEFHYEAEVPRKSQEVLGSTFEALKPCRIQENPVENPRESYRILADHKRILQNPIEF